MKRFPERGRVRNGFGTIEAAGEYLEYFRSGVQIYPHGTMLTATAMVLHIKETGHERFMYAVERVAKMRESHRDIQFERVWTDRASVISVGIDVVSCSTGLFVTTI